MFTKKLHWNHPRFSSQGTYENSICVNRVLQQALSLKLLKCFFFLLLNMIGSSHSKVQSSCIHEHSVGESQNILYQRSSAKLGKQ